MTMGAPGSGKSTLAARLGEITALPLCHMDHIHWRPGWVERPKAERPRMIGEVAPRRLRTQRAMPLLLARVYAYGLPD